MSPTAANTGAGSGAGSGQADGVHAAQRHPALAACGHILRQVGLAAGRHHPHGQAALLGVEHHAVALARGADQAVDLALGQLGSHVLIPYPNPGPLPGSGPTADPAG